MEGDHEETAPGIPSIYITGMNGWSNVMTGAFGEGGKKGVSLPSLGLHLRVQKCHNRQKTS